MTQRTVAGESIELLRSALGKLKLRTRSDGIAELTGTLEPELGRPLWRAIMQIERELLDQDGTKGDPKVRTTEQRRADAFVLLVDRSLPCSGGLEDAGRPSCTPSLVVTHFLHE